MAEQGEGLGTRERLVEAARVLFHSQGFTATGLAQILKQAGVNSGSLYHYFRSKEDLLLAVLDRYQEMLWPDLIQPIFDHCQDPLERIYGLLSVYRQGLLATDCTFGCPIGNLALELNEFHPEAQQKIAANFTGWRQAVEACLVALGSRLPAEVDRAALATFILTTMEGGVMQSRSYRSIEPFDASVRMLRDYIDRLLTAARASSAGTGQGEH